MDFWAWVYTRIYQGYTIPVYTGGDIPPSYNVVHLPPPLPLTPHNAIAFGRIAHTQSCCPCPIAALRDGRRHAVTERNLGNGCACRLVTPEEKKNARLLVINSCKKEGYESRQISSFFFKSLFVDPQPHHPLLFSLFLEERVDGG